ncbi:unnamed protein product [Ceratitis capitata]|uniref:(Mediterranean fruit fly) hypothetical protein n=1 Tax=Ceratitis capitata TaxID=7213 RepID=A0A811UB50_CERCA|nr:unnamed protein product [Ceratitis capitata]
MNIQDIIDRSTVGQSCSQSGKQAGRPVALQAIKLAKRQFGSPSVSCTGGPSNQQSSRVNTSVRSFGANHGAAISGVAIILSAESRWYTCDYRNVDNMTHKQSFHTLVQYT